MTSRTEPAPAQPAGPDDVSIRRWFTAYGLMLLVACGVLAVLLAREPWSLSDWTRHPRDLFAQTSPAVKLLVYGIYLTLCCTFLPLPTGWIVAAVATREAAVSSSAAVTVSVVAAIGALATTIANLNDYHLFTWMLRHRRIARVRDSRVYRAAAGWFARSPLLILVIFNIVPIPVDVIRMLATTYRYPRLPFAVANFLGRFIRYGAISYVTYWLDLGKWAVLVLLGLAVVLGAAKVIPMLVRRILHRRTNGNGREVSEQRRE